MDLRAMLNTDGGGAGVDRSNATQPGRPLQAPPQPVSTSTSLGATTPSTPVQTGPPPPHSFRDYSHSTHASPVSQPREYPPPGHQHQNPQSAVPGPAAYGSPTGYHPSAGGPYAGRPSVPPLQPLAPQEIRSPGSASLSGPSPFRQTPTSSTSVGSTGYPFPPTQQPPASPGQRHQYGAPNYSRDSYPSQPPSAGVAPLQGPGPYPQSQHQQQSIPQTPPVGTPGGSHQYLQQRSLSIHSTPTPTSAQSQHPPYPPPYAQGSPVATHHAPAPLDQHLRHQSPQPATPLGPPTATHHRQSPAISYQQPPSPYQQRMSSTSGPYQQILKASPPPPPPASIPRMPSSGHSAYDVTSASQRRSQSQQSQSERERSISVSPKTRVPSLPSSTGQPAPAEKAYYHSQPRLQPQPPPGSAANMELQRDVTPAKRKIDDRDLRPEEVENQRPPPPPPNKTNGNHGILPQRFSATSTMPPAKKRVKYDSPPIWAQSGRKRPLAASRNFSIKQPAGGASGPASNANGAHHEPGPSIKAERPSRHTSPETARSSTLAREESSYGPAKDQSTFGGQPFPWEPSIEGSKPIDLISRHAADFFVFNVLQGPKLEDLSARGASIEIEAKLGTIIDRSTNERIDVQVQAGECIIGEGARIAFRSSMSESQHRALNGYLNEQVKASFPRNPSAGSRVQIEYVHRRETDRFFELPNQLRHRVPPSFAHLLHPNAPLKARVTYDQKTGNHLASIVKARVADLHIHMAHLPLDCRISVNIEWKWDGPPQEIEQNQIPNKDRQPDRSKDRLSYKHGFYQIDLTQVTQATLGPQGQSGPPSKEHELEIELQGEALYRHGMLLMSHEPNRYADLVDGLIDNVRVLARKCPPQ